VHRRRFLELAGISGLAALGPRPPRAATGRTANDVSQLNPVGVAEERRPRSTDEIRAALRAWPGAVSLGGGRFSMGGQIAAPGSLHLDMRAMNQVVSFDPTRRLIRVQSGMTWRDLQDVIDPHDLAVKIMQSYSNFTVGGSVSVNGHGRYVGRVDEGARRGGARQRRTLLSAVSAPRHPRPVRARVSGGPDVRRAEGAHRSRPPVPEPALGHVSTGVIEGC